MMRFLILSALFASIVFGLLQTAGATGPVCFNYGKTKDYDRLCIVTKIEGNRMCMVDYHVPSKTRGQYEVCEFIRDRGNASVGDQIIVDAQEFKNDSTGKCYKSPGCGKAIVVSSGSSKQTGSASLPPPSPQPPVKGGASLPPPPLPEGEQAQQQPSAASLPPPPQQPQPQTQTSAQQEPQQPVTQTIDNTLNIFKKARDLFK